MSISGLTGTSANLYLQYLTGSSTSTTLGSTASESSTDSTSTLDTTYLDQAAGGTVLSAKEQSAAQAQLSALTLTRLLDVTA
jgi:hypothetical protein